MLKNALKCPLCKNNQDEPRLLPCGKSICLRCCTIILEQNVKKFKCEICNQLHKIPTNIGFPLIESLLLVVLDSCLKDLEHKLDSNTINFENQVNEIKANINTSSEQLINRIIKSKNDLIEQVNRFEEKLIDKLRNNFNLKQIIEFNSKWRRNLEEENEDDFISSSTVSEAIREAARLKELNLDDLHRCHIYYDQRYSLVDESILGHVKYSLDLLLSDHELKELLNSCKITSNVRLVYKAVEDGFKSSDFHSKCDVYDKTLVVIKTCNNSILGGYTEQNWSSKCVKWKNDSNAFVFNIRNKQVSMFRCVQHEHAIRCDPKHGPSFGYTDLIVCNEANERELNYSSLGVCYSPDLNKKFHLDSKYSFSLLDFEVYCVL